MSTGPDVEEVRKILVSWADAFNRADIDHLVGLYAESSILICPGLPPGHGLAVIADIIKDIWASGCKDVEIHEQIVEQLSDDVIVSTGNWTHIWAETNQRRNLMDITVWKRFPDGKWKCIRDLFNYRT